MNLDRIVLRQEPQFQYKKLSSLWFSLLDKYLNEETKHLKIISTSRTNIR